MITTKAHVIAEIRRTASENGGNPLGVERFLSETGIKESAWRGRFWVRWGDALAEAGFGPTQWNARVEEADLLGPLAALTKELGHFPVRDELKLKRRTDPNFPSHNTFVRFGNQDALAARLREFCATRNLHDIAVLCVARGSSSRPNGRPDANAVAKSELPANAQEKKSKFHDARERLVAAIQSWTPQRRREREEAYKVELRSYLEDQRFSVREESGDSKADLVIAGKIPIELKKSPTLSEYDRLFGQMARHLAIHGSVIAVICDIERRDQFDEFGANVDMIYRRLGYDVSIVPK